MHCVKKSPYLVFSVLYFTAFGVNAEIYPYAVQMWEYTDQKNSEYGRFSRSGNLNQRKCCFYLNEKLEIRKQSTKQNQSCWICADTTKVLYYGIIVRTSSKVFHESLSVMFPKKGLLIIVLLISCPHICTRHQWYNCKWGSHCWWI